MDIQGTTALVTGANRGIGRAFVEALMAAGAKKIYAAARDIKSLDIFAGSPTIHPLALDITDATRIREVAASHTDVDLLINNAGIAMFAGVIAADNLEAARAEMETNYFSTLEIIRAFAGVLKANGGGAIVNLSSIGGLVNVPMIGSYCASKAAVHSMTQAVRAELASQQTLVIGVYPGPVDTDMAEKFPMEKAKPSDAAQAVLHALAEGVEDVYPDAMASGVRDGLLSDGKSIEREFAAMLPGAA